MYWMRKRFGSAGAARLRILEKIRRESPEVWDAAVTPIGLTPDQLAAFSARHELSCIADFTSLRGDTGNLESIAWWGSAIADVAVVSHSPVRVRTMEEAAAFNLAVALFDSLVECETTSAQQLKGALAPDRMRRRLNHPGEQGAALDCADPLASHIARLFDFTLASVGGRCCAQSVSRAEMVVLLEGMYLGATSERGDPMLAKRGPVMFIGLLADLDGGRASRSLALALATFCQQWDDWQDLAEDLRRLAPNSFLGVPPRRFHIETLGYIGNAAIRLVGGRWCHPPIAKAISSSVINVLVAARHIGLEHHNKAISLCHALIV